MSQRTPLASNAGTTASLGAASARSLSTAASAAELSWVSASRSTTGVSESCTAEDIGTAVGAGGSRLAQAARATIGHHRSSRFIMLGGSGTGLRIGADRVGNTHESGRRAEICKLLVYQLLDWLIGVGFSCDGAKSLAGRKKPPRLSSGGHEPTAAPP